MKITHLGVYQIFKDKVFDNVNSCDQMNKTIAKYGGNPKTEQEHIEYGKKIGIAFEIYTQFFYIRYNNDPSLGVKDIKDTSENPFNPGYDFTHTSLYDKRGHVQAKWRENPLHQFTAHDMGTNGDAAYSLGVLKDDNILFINFDDNEELFHYDFPYARNGRRVIGRKTQEEEYIRNNPKFWDEFRECIEESAKDTLAIFEKEPILRNVQEWILNGKYSKHGMCIYEGTQAVIGKLIHINGKAVIEQKYHKGRVEAATATGKSLCIMNDVKRAFENGRDIAVVLLPWRPLIEQTFEDFYKYKMFTKEDDNHGFRKNNTSCLIVRSGGFVRAVGEFADVNQLLAPNEIAGHIIDKVIGQKKKLVIFITMMSYEEKYVKILDNIFKRGIDKNQIIEIIDEYHNMIPSGGTTELYEKKRDFLITFNERNSGTIFYSASNKIGNIISYNKEEQFGPLLCKINRENLRAMGYVAPKLEFRIIEVKPESNSSELVREAASRGIKLNDAMSESVGIVKAFDDLRNHYKILEPNVITFGDHVEGCRYITNEDQTINNHLTKVSFHFIASETTANERMRIIKEIKTTGNNILNQHSVAKEGVNIPNLSGGIIDRKMNTKSIQQAIGRSDRALYEDTINFQKGLISLDKTEGWKKYYNVIYVIVDDNNESIANRIENIVEYLLDNGIPEDKWDISNVEDEERSGVDTDIPNISPKYKRQSSFHIKKYAKMVNNAITKYTARKEAERKAEEDKKDNSKPKHILIEENF